ncbi:MAG: hypothetical protein WDN27_03385 [Candidatus Saccharibacteria bacterium]
MKLVVLYRPNGEFGSGVEEFVRGLQTRHDVPDEQIRVVDYDSPEGTAMAGTYGLMSEPSLIVVDDDGGYVKHWEGSELPLLEEVAGYLHTGQ